MKKILLVEDDPFLVDIYSTKLENAGFSVEVAPDGRTGLQKIREGEFDLVVLDIVLPQMDGWEVLREVKKDPQLQNVRIFVFSNLGQKEEVEKGLEMGAVKYFIKAHFTPQDIVDEIKKTLL
ncbi:MAG: response regulator [Candidatus Nealsonbacteria bacterium]|nr:response regulator [Candidatus Nealsonbacteria bacterium]